VEIHYQVRYFIMLNPRLLRVTNICFSYRSQEQWQLEGVQPGGVRSGPVYGVWTQWGHEDHSPVGAFLYVPEELCKKQELVAVGRSADSI
jgi:hypothetical protein